MSKLADENVYRAFFEHSIDAMLIATSQGGILAANSSACEMFRRTEEDICNVGRSGLFEKGYLPIESLVAERDRVGRTRGDLMFRRGDGTHFMGDLSSTLYQGRNGEIFSLVVIRDLTLRYQIQQELSESNALLNSIVNSTHDLIWSVDAETFGLLFFNQSIYDYFLLHRQIKIQKGMSPEVLYQKPIFVQTWRDLYQRALREEHFTTEYRGIAGPVVMLLNFNVLKRNGSVYAISVFGKDITERTRAVEALTKSEERFQLTMEATQEGIWDWNAVTNEVFYSPACYHMLGYEVGDFPGTLEGWQKLLHPEDVRQTMQINMDCVEGRRENFVVEYRMKAKSGEWRWTLGRGKSIARDTQGRATRLVGTNVDITERKHTEEQLALYMKQLENSMEGTLIAVSKMVEQRDPYTGGHERRVGIIAANIARIMGWPEDKCRNLQNVGTVHDIGKIAIPAELLTKPTRLSNLEYEMIKTHAEKGYEILKDVEFPLPIAEIIYQHHERLDGSGYPRGLKGNDILPEARILAVADVIEAMGSHRPYRASLGLEKALDEIERGAGTLYDETVVNACLLLFREYGYQLPE